MDEQTTTPEHEIELLRQLDRQVSRFQKTTQSLIDSVHQRGVHRPGPDLTQRQIVIELITNMLESLDKALQAVVKNIGS